MDPIILLALFSGVSIATGLFLAGYFAFIRREDRRRDFLLALLIMALVLRVGKSIVYYLIVNIADVGVAIGFLGLSTIGPFLYLYFRKVNYRHTDYLHFLIPVAGFLTCLMFPRLNTLSYQLATLVLSGYLVYLWITELTAAKAYVLRKWHRLLLTGFSLVTIAFVFQHLVETLLLYAVGAAIASVIIYALFLYALMNPKLFPKLERGLKHGQEVIGAVKKGLEEDKLYRLSNLTMNQFAERIGQPSYRVSKAINILYSKTFPQVVNTMRVEEVKEKLRTQNGNKIEGMAYDVGFNTPSAFYAAFKKETNVTPTEYLKRI